MKKIRLSVDDIQEQNENALDLFYSGIKSKETKRTMERNLREFLIGVCADLLQGDFEQRAQEFVKLARDEQQKAMQIILAYVMRLRERAQTDRANPDYLNPSTIPNKIKPIRKLLDMNGLGLAWRRIYSAYPELDNNTQGRGYTLEEIKKLLEHSPDIATDFIILASSSGGFRVGAWDGLTWGSVFPIYQVGKEYKIELDKKEHGKIVCAGMTIYKGTPEEYHALISVEAWNKLQEYHKIWVKKVGRQPVDSDPLILERFTKITPITSVSVKRRIEHLLYNSGIRTPLTEGKRRHAVPATHGFRRFWDKVMMNVQKNKGTLAALAIKERLMGHDGIVSTDKNYFWTDVLDLVPDYLEAMPDLMINDDYRIQKKLEEEKAKTEKLERANQEKEEALQKLKELEAKVNRMSRYRIT
jgi:hypothetical protein